jgi:tRNA(fMet)-specific endonuclease VapC
MYLLDTDHASFLQRPQTHEGQRVRFRLSATGQEDRVISVITFEEQMRGWMTAIAKAKTLPEQIAAYHWIEKALPFYLDFKLQGFDENAALQFQWLQKQRVRIGTMDLKIAAIALSLNATLLSRNLRDFSKVPGLQVEDWSGG